MDRHERAGWAKKESGEKSERAGAREEGSWMTADRSSLLSRRLTSHPSTQSASQAGRPAALRLLRPSSFFPFVPSPSFRSDMLCCPVSGFFFFFLFCLFFLCAGRRLQYDSVSSQDLWKEDYLRSIFTQSVSQKVQQELWAIVQNNPSGQSSKPALPKEKLAPVVRVFDCLLGGRLTSGTICSKLGHNVP